MGIESLLLDTSKLSNALFMRLKKKEWWWDEGAGRPRLGLVARIEKYF
jgi:hypothetical protein